MTSTQRSTVPTRVPDQGHAGNRSAGGFRRPGLRARATVGPRRRGQPLRVPPGFRITATARSMSMRSASRRESR